MDAERFETLTRVLIAATSRRRTVSRLLGGWLAGLGFILPAKPGPSPASAGRQTVAYGMMR
jgi:hypothetical protein